MKPQSGKLADQQVLLGPIKAVEVHVAEPPRDRQVSESIGNETVPFEKVRHLVADRPLAPPRRRF